jgi:hypothetical protein
MRKSNFADSPCRARTSGAEGSSTDLVVARLRRAPYGKTTAILRIIAGLVNMATVLRPRDIAPRTDIRVPRCTEVHLLVQSDAMLVCERNTGKVEQVVR